MLSSELARDGLRSYVPDLAAAWPSGQRSARISGTLASVDISGFTALSERLAGRGREGAEEVTAAASHIFTGLIDIARGEGGDILSFGGDAILVLFRGTGHAVAACRALMTMQRRMSADGRFETAAGRIRIRIAASAHSGEFCVVRVGRRQPALAVVGADASRVVRLEAAAGGGRIATSAATAARLPSTAIRAAGPDVFLLRGPPVAGSARGQAGRPPDQDVSRWIAPEIAEHIRIAQGIGTHTPVSVAFVGVTGTDRLLAGSGVARVGRALDAVADAVEGATAPLGVTWLGVDIADDGLKFILAAGVPRSREDDEERLLRAVRAILAQPIPDVSVRIGAARGHVFAGDLGHPSRRTFTIMGDTVNLAARLMARADEGRALVGADLPRASRTRFGFEPLPPFVVRGRRGPVQAGTLGPPIGGRHPMVHSALIGRDAEMGRIGEVLALCQAGTGSALEIVGGGGSGKTHLVAEAVGRSELQIAWGRGDPYEMTMSFAVVAPALRALILPGHDAEEGPPTEAGLAARLEQIAPELIPWMPLIGEAIGVASPETPATLGLDPVFRQRRLREVVVDLLGRGPSGRVLVIDDAQWSDESSLELLRALVSAPRQAGVAVIAMHRLAERTETLLGGPESLHLGPLSPAAARDLVLRAAGSPLPEDGLERILRLGGGHPLFLAQLVAAVDSGLTDLPDDVERLIRARIDQLGHEERLLLRQASVAGRVARIEVLARVLGDRRIGDPATWRPLSEFVDLADGEVRFVHDLYRDVAYATLPVRHRRELHARLGTVLLEESPPDALDALTPLLAGHFHVAGLWSEAGRYARRGAVLAAARAAWPEAAELRRIEEHAGVARGSSPDRLAQVAQERARALEHMGRTAEALAALSATRPAVTPGVRAQSHIQRARLSQRLGRIAPALRDTAHALRLAGSLSPRERDRIEVAALLRRASIREHQGRYREAMRLSRRAFDAAAGRRRGLAAAQFYYAAFCLQDDAAESTATIATRLLRRYGRPVELGDFLNNRGVDSYWMGRWAEAVALYAESAQHYRRGGDTTGVALSMNNAGQILIDQGRLDSAREPFSEARRIFLAASDRFMVAANDSALATIATRQGDLGEADRLLTLARAVHESVQAEEYVVDADLRRAELLLAEGRDEAALSLAEQCLARATAIENDMLVRWARRMRAQALAGTATTEAALAEMREVVEEARRAEAMADVLFGLAAIDGLIRRSGEQPDAALEEELATLARDLGVVALPPSPAHPLRPAATLA